MVNWPDAGLDSLPKPIATTKRNAAGFELSQVISDHATLLERMEARWGMDAASSTPTNVDDVLYVTGAGATAYGKRGLVKIAEASGTGSSGVITFSGIPATYRELELSIYGRSSASSTAVQCQMTLNGNTTAGDYDSEWGLASQTSASAVEHLGDVGYVDVGNFPGANSTANLFSSTKVWFPEYAQTTGWKTVHFLTANLLTLVTGNLTPRFGSAAFESTAALSSITLTLASGNWIAGSRATLWARAA